METTIILWNICSCKRIKDSTTETRGTGLRTTLNADKRIDGIDFWRGVALLTIFIDHAPDNVFQKITVGNFGFSDAADLFVFLSGASVALAYGSRFFGGKTAAAIRAVFRRAFTLYWVQILISLLTIGISIAAALWWGDDDLIEADDTDVVVSSPLLGISAMLALAHQLYNANILPLYIVLLLITPVLLSMARRSDWLMLSVSALIYLAARVFELNLPSWPLDDGWFFNPLAWQFIFAIGLFVGRRLPSGGIPYDRRLFVLGVAILAASLVVVTDGLGLVPGLSTDVRAVLDGGKTNLGPLRLVHYLALAYVISHSGLTQLLRRTIVYWPLAMIGRRSLPVFATGCVLVTIGDVMVDTRPEDFSHPLALGAAIVAVGVLLHYAVARILAARGFSTPPGIGDAMRAPYKTGAVRATASRMAPARSRAVQS